MSKQKYEYEFHWHTFTEGCGRKTSYSEDAVERIIQEKAIDGWRVHMIAPDGTVLFEREVN